MTFREIDDALVQCVDPETGEVDTERFDSLQGERNQKLESIALWTVDLKAEEAAIAEEIKRLTARKTAVANKRESLRAFLAYQLNGDKLKTPLVSVTVKQIKDVIIDDINKLPAEFVQEVTEKKVDRAALRKAFDEWEIIDGAHVEKKPSVTVR